METKANWHLSDSGVAYANKVLDEMQNESDRATSILLGAELDDTLNQILEKYLLPPRSKKYTRALAGNFYTRIELVYRLGLIHSMFHSELHLIRDIRNEFAHKTLGVNFESSKVVALTSKLVFAKAADLYVSPKAAQEPELKSLINQNSRDRFILSGALLLHRLIFLSEQISRVPVSTFALH